MNNFFQQNKLIKSRWLAMHRQRFFTCSLNSGFTTLMNERTLYIISTSCVLYDQYALACKALSEFLKIVLNM